MSNVICAWDPGGTTGFCAGILDPQQPSGFRILESAIVPWPNRFSRIRGLIDLYRPHTTIVEPFVLYKHKAKDQIGSKFPSSQVIGIIEAYLYMTGCAMPIYQGAFLIAGKPPVQVLPEHEGQLWLEGSVDLREHARDAYKHLRYWVVQHQQPTRVAAGKVRP